MPDISRETDKIFHALNEMLHEEYGTCPKCGGSGVIYAWFDKLHLSPKVCLRCHGSGTYVKEAN